MDFFVTLARCAASHLLIGGDDSKGKLTTLGRKRMDFLIYGVILFGFLLAVDLATAPKY